MLSTLQPRQLLPQLREEVHKQVQATLNEAGLLQFYLNSFVFLFKTNTGYSLNGWLSSSTSDLHIGYNFVVDKIMRRTLEGLQNPGVRIACEENLVDLEYADDIVLMFEEEEKAQVFLDELTKVIPSFGMHFAPTKCKVMLVDVQSLNTPLTIQGETLEFVERFTYLGSCISCDCSVTDEVNAQICKARAAFANSRHLWRQRSVSMHLKGRIKLQCGPSCCTAVRLGLFELRRLQTKDKLTRTYRPEWRQSAGQMENRARYYEESLPASQRIDVSTSSQAVSACEESLVDPEYADGIVLMFEEEEKAQVFLDELTKVIPSFGMHSAPTKCKVMLVDVQSLNTPLTIQGEALEVVERFIVADEVNARICKARAAFANLRHLWRQNGLSLNLKGRVYQARVRAVLLYGCETWPIRAAELRRLQGWCRRIRNEAVRKRVFGCVTSTFIEECARHLKLL
ncbi:hypothetical protein T265_11753 [Opisthorchis viverrini]|uniref:Reverse transcriptase domain-containing protein n=1 Tax=Opisthorchis viverrini TaxID=6198 RepID=A0A074YXU6_OPIVI|nr:hypothetical protein T265_11753 [Opisthorchis viverrini]KER19493.1 hypothetical protein T265_11753 [Opisthorchis viverrini]